METLTATPMTSGLTDRRETVADFSRTRGNGVMATVGGLAGRLSQNSKCDELRGWVVSVMDEGVCLRVCLVTVADGHRLNAA